MNRRPLVIPTAIIIAASAEALASSPVRMVGRSGSVQQKANMEHIAALARQSQEEARRFGAELRSPKPEAREVEQKLLNLAQHVSELRAAIVNAGLHPWRLSPEHREQVRRMSDVADVLQHFIDKKRKLIAADGLRRNTSVLRAKAMGLAMRAELIERYAVRARG